MLSDLVLIFSHKFGHSSLPAHLLQLCSFLFLSFWLPLPLCVCRLQLLLYSPIPRGSISASCIPYLTGFIFSYYHARKVNPSAIRDTHVDNWLSWKLQSWKFAASVFYFKHFSISYKFLWKVRVSVLVFEFQRHLELFVRLSSVVKVPGWVNNISFNERWSNMESNQK